MRGGTVLTLTISLSLFSSLAMAQVSTLSLVPSDDLIFPGEPHDPIDIEVFLDRASELAGWQVAIEVTGGDAGSLDLANLFIDTTRSDYVFNGFSSFEATALVTGEMGAVLLSPIWIDVTPPPVYLGTFQFQPSNDAMGMFNIRFVDDTNRTFLLVGIGIHDAPNLNNDTVIDFVQCINDAGCDDANECTDDTCSDGTCVNSNDDTNTCTDGNECTDDTCSSGTCVSTNDDTNTCTDGNECTDDACSSGTCISTNDDTNACTDGSDCTSDVVCVSGVCAGTNLPVGTTCDDGLFCTTTDECDGGGTCVGSGSPCLGRNPYCCEYLSTCGPAPCS